jgi:hypothetical protein
MPEGELRNVQLMQEIYLPEQSVSTDPGVDVPKKKPKRKRKTPECCPYMVPDVAPCVYVPEKERRRLLLPDRPGELFIILCPQRCSRSQKG